MHFGMNIYIYIFFAVFEMYLHCFMIASVVRFSNLLFCNILSSFSTQNDPFLLKHYPLIATVIVYDAPSIEVSVLSLVIIIFEWTYYLKSITSCLRAYLLFCE